MKRFPLWCATALLPLLAACSFSVIPKTGYTETRTFDLSSPAPFGELPFIVEVESFSNECSGRYKMVVREDPNRIDVDEYNRWAMPPGAMLTKYLAARFAVPPDNHLSQSKKPVFVLDGSVLNCELNKPQKQVELLVHFIIIKPGKDDFRITGTENCTVPVKETTAEAISSGMDKAAGQFADRVVAIIQNELRTHAVEEKTISETK